MGELTYRVLDDQLVPPLLPGSRKSKVILPNFDGVEHFKHLRREDPRTIDALEVNEAATPGEAAETIAGPVIYGGVAFDHFGHFIAESIHRIWPKWRVAEFADCPVAFHVTNRNLPSVPWVSGVLRVLGLDPDKAIWLRKPVRFERLIVPDQARRLSGASPDPSYADLIANATRACSEAAQDRSPHLYISRKHFYYSGSYLGERLVEKKLSQAGFRVIYPELEPLEKLIAICRRAKTIVLSEGSAIHILELCGRIDAHVFIVGRRTLPFMKGHWGVLLTEIASSHTLFEPEAQITPLDYDTGNDRPKWGNASADLDIAKLLSAISERSGVPVDIPKEAVLNRAKREDLFRIMVDPRSTGRATDAAKLGELLALLRRQLATSPFMADLK